jgi:hypothetical protein
MENYKTDGVIDTSKNGSQLKISKDASSGGLLIGKAHSDEGGGIKAIVIEDKRPILVENGEVIINKHAAKKHWRKLNEINQSAGGGAPIHEPQFEKGATIDKISFDNFHVNTSANFKSIDNVPEKKPDYVSESGSKYWYESDSVIRQANHWGTKNEQGKCNWLLNGAAHSELSQGKCQLNEFTPQFSKGGDFKTQELKSTNLDNAIVTKWSEIPEIWKKTKNISTIKIHSLNPQDKAIQKISDIFTGGDSLRPVMSGTYFDEFGITATDAHRLFFKQGKHSIRGIYPLSKHARTEEIKKTKKGLIDGNYPNYQAVVPTKSDIVCEIDINKLYTYLAACQNYVNKSNFHVQLAYGRDKIYAFNSLFLIDICETLISLNETVAYFGLSDSASRAVIISPDAAVADKPHTAFNKKDSILILQMPVMAYDDFVGAREIDGSVSNSCYFDLKDSEIHNADDSIVKEYQPKDFYPEYINEKTISVVKIFTEKNTGSYILDCALIEDGNLYITDNNVQVSMPVSKQIENGTYFYLDGYLRKSDVDVDSYPRIKPLSKESKSIAVVDSGSFLYQLNYANLFIERDDFRPAFNCANFTFTENKMQVIGTDAQCLYKNEITVESSVERYVITMESPKVVAKILAAFDEQPLVIKSDNEMCSISGYEFDMIVTKSSSKYPFIEGTLPKMSSKIIEFYLSDLTNIDKKGNKTIHIVGNQIMIGGEVLKGMYKIHDLSEPKQLDTTRGIYIGSATKLKQRLSKLNSNTVDIYVSYERKHNEFWIPLSESKQVVRKNKIVAQVKKETTQEEINKEWQEVLETAQMMLDSDISAEEKSEWLSQLETAKMMLEI